MGCLLFYTVGNMHSVTSNAVASAITGSEWICLVENQYGGSFTVPDSAKEILINISTDNTPLGSIHFVMSYLSDKTSVIIPVNNDKRSIWNLSNSGKTFTWSGGDYRRIYVYYK